jgi:hypothetical protein
VIVSMLLKALLRRISIRHFLCWLLVWFSPIHSIPAGYKAREYAPLPIESYPSRLTSQGITVAVDPMFTDAIASKAFDKKDIVTRGIMPLAIIIFNSNGFAVEVKATSIELIIRGNRIFQVSPEIAMRRILQQTAIPSQTVYVPSPIPLPRVAIYKSNTNAYDDFVNKYLGVKRIEPKSLAAGFIYLPVENSANLRENLKEAQIYIPDLRRADTKDSMMFLEIDLKPAVNAIPEK